MHIFTLKEGRKNFFILWILKQIYQLSSSMNENYQNLQLSIPSVILQSFEETDSESDLPFIKTVFIPLWTDHISTEKIDSRNDNSKSQVLITHPTEILGSCNPTYRPMTSTSCTRKLMMMTMMTILHHNSSINRAHPLFLLTTFEQKATVSFREDFLYVIDRSINLKVGTLRYTYVRVVKWAKRKKKQRNGWVDVLFARN